MRSRRHSISTRPQQRAHYRAGFYFEATADRFLYTHSFWLLNAGIRLHPNTDIWDVGVFGKNLTIIFIGKMLTKLRLSAPAGGPILRFCRTRAPAVSRDAT
jgi:hypothetical protein